MSGLGGLDVMVRYRYYNGEVLINYIGKYKSLEMVLIPLVRFLSSQRPTFTNR